MLHFYSRWAPLKIQEDAEIRKYSDEEPLIIDDVVEHPVKPVQPEKVHPLDDNTPIEKDDVVDDDEEDRDDVKDDNKPAESVDDPWDEDWEDDDVPWSD